MQNPFDEIVASLDVLKPYQQGARYNSILQLYVRLDVDVRRSFPLPPLNGARCCDKTEQLPLAPKHRAPGPWTRSCRMAIMQQILKDAADDFFSAISCEWGSTVEPEHHRYYGFIHNKTYQSTYSFELPNQTDHWHQHQYIDTRKWNK
eukprot:3004124-Rhodomonas_salina.1